MIGLGVLIFIHEIGHYFMAKRVKMKIETFSIGFGKPIFSWHRKKIKWQICILPFGGFVKIAGMQKEGELEPYQIPNGFFAKKPIQRIKVALMGPLTNIVFAFLVFSFIWTLGGRDKVFSEFTKKIGYIDPKSALFDNNVRNGDEITKYNKKNYASFFDFMYEQALTGKEIEIEGYKINYYQRTQEPFNYKLKTYSALEFENDIKTVGIFAPARYFIFDKKNKNFNPTLNIQDNDRILWVNGQMIFSDHQLQSVLNENSVFLTIQRENKVFQSKLNLIKAGDLKIPRDFKNDIEDWKYFAKIKTNFDDLKVISYTLTDDLEIEGSLDLIDKNNSLKLTDERDEFSKPLEKKDKILAVNGHKIKNSFELLEFMQDLKMLMIVQRDFFTKKIPYKDEDKVFDTELNIESLNKIIANIGTKNEITALNNFILFKSVKAYTLKQIAKINEELAKEYSNAQKTIANIKDPIKKEVFIKLINNKKLWCFFNDKKVKYNPNPIKMFFEEFKRIFRTFISLITGYLSPKHISGPVGIVRIMKMSWSLGFLEALYWLGFISLNLGFLNLLPMPVLDGGHILFSVVEMITKKPIKAKTMERLIIPFVVLLIGAVIFITYHDILRIIRSFF